MGWTEGSSSQVLSPLSKDFLWTFYQMEMNPEDFGNVSGKHPAGRFSPHFFGVKTGTNYSHNVWVMAVFPRVVWLPNLRLNPHRWRRQPLLNEADGLIPPAANPSGRTASRCLSCGKILRSDLIKKPNADGECSRSALVWANTMIDQRAGRLFFFCPRAN